VVGGETHKGDANGTITLSLAQGSYTLQITRPGYLAEEITIDSKGEPTFAYLAGAVFLIVLVAYLYFLFIHPPKKRELIIDEVH
jgi:hypothetical protein